MAGPVAEPDSLAPEAQVAKSSGSAPPAGAINLRWVWKRKKVGRVLSAIGCCCAALRHGQASRGARRSLDRCHPLDDQPPTGGKRGRGRVLSANNGGCRLTVSAA